MMLAFVSGGLVVIAAELLWGLYVWHEARKAADPYEWPPWGP